MDLVYRIGKIEHHLERVRQALARAQSQRLILGLCVFLLLVFSQVFKGFYLELLGLFVFLPVFIVFFIKSRRLYRFSEQLESLKSFYKCQLDMAEGRFPEEIPAEKMNNPHLARDLDLGVFLAGMNRCFSIEAQHTMDSWMGQNFSGTSFEERRVWISQLTAFPGLIRRLQIQPITKKASLKRIQNEVDRSFFEKPMKWRHLVAVFWLSLVACLFVPLPSLVIKIIFLLYVGSMLFFINETKYLFSRIQDLENDLSALGDIIPLAERISQNIDLASNLKKQAASQDVGLLKRLISFMSVKTNPILFYLLNMILPWDYLLAEFAERARKNLQQHFAMWSNELKMMDACIHFASLKIYHKTCWPKLEESGDFINIKNMAHPLLDQNQVVTNNFSPDGNSVFIITGSNMSGKSTFLRAIGLNFCLAQIGAPVFASEMSFKPLQLMTCIRVSDSLRDGQSYFYAEVQRMKDVLKQAKNTQVLFLIDEPLRGTNNRERLIGNKKYLEQILSTGSFGFISTHDLELTQLADDDPKICNSHFSEQWINEDLTFDYKIKKGPSTSTNALKILAKEGLYPMDLL